MSEYNNPNLILGTPSEMDRATEIETRILSKRNGDGCPFCGHRDLQTIVRPVLGDTPMQPALPSIPTPSGAWPVTLLVCQNCNFVMPFMESGYITEGLD